MARSGRPHLWIGVAAVILGWLALGALAGPLSGRLSSVQENDNAAFLPSETEATRALRLQERFAESEVFPAVVVYERAAGLTAADRTAIAADVEEFAQLPRLVGRPSPPIPSTDGAAVQVVVPLDGTDGLRIAEDVARVRNIATTGTDLRTFVTGLAGLQADFAKVFETIDSTLLLATAVVVVVILLLIYRSPVLWLVPIAAAGMSLTVAQAVVYLAAEYADLAVNGQSQGILTVLVFGAGTDYALLLIARYREELRRHESKYDAMRRALRGCRTGDRRLRLDGHPRPAVPVGLLAGVEPGVRAGRRHRHRLHVGGHAVPAARIAAAGSLAVLAVRSSLRVTLARGIRSVGTGCARCRPPSARLLGERHPGAGRTRGRRPPAPGRRHPAVGGLHHPHRLGGGSARPRPALSRRSRESGRRHRGRRPAGAAAAHGAKGAGCRRRQLLHRLPGRPELAGRAGTSSRAGGRRRARAG